MRKHGEVYLHIGNSGVTFRVVDEGDGPTIQIRSGAFGNMQNELTLRTTKRALAELGQMFTDVATESYSPDYCHAADLTESREPSTAKQAGRQLKEALAGAVPPVEMTGRILVGQAVRGE